MAAFLLPALRSARESAKRTRCISNLKQIGLALIMYAADYEDRVPPVASPYQTYLGGQLLTWGTPTLWGGWGLLYSNGYVPDLQVFYCPSDQNFQWVEGVSNPDWRWISYTFRTPYNDSASVGEPYSTTVNGSLSEAQNRGMVAGSDYIYIGSAPQVLAHRDGINVLYFAGNVRWYNDTNFDFSWFSGVDYKYERCDEYWYNKIDNKY